MIIPKKIHTSGLTNFRRCRRKWQYTLEWEPIEESANLWFGSAFHHGLAELHGNGRDPVEAMLEYLADRIRFDWDMQKPVEMDDMVALGKGMFETYFDWSQSREGIMIVDATEVLEETSHRPLIEVDFEIPIEVNGKTAKYEGTFDGIGKDLDGNLWVVEYKTASSFDTNKLVNDPQVTAYCWAAEKVFGERFYGVIYQQHLKALPAEPRVLKSGKLSKDKSQRTTYALYRKAIRDMGLPKHEYEDILQHLFDQEEEYASPFVRRDFIDRSPEELESFERNLYLQLGEYLNLSLPIYPNPTRNCAWDCDFRTPCLALEMGSDPIPTLESLFKRKE